MIYDLSLVMISVVIRLYIVTLSIHFMHFSYSAHSPRYKKNEE